MDKIWDYSYNSAIVDSTGKYISFRTKQYVLSGIVDTLRSLGNTSKLLGYTESNTPFFPYVFEAKPNEESKFLHYLISTFLDLNDDEKLAVCNYLYYVINLDENIVERPAKSYLNFLTVKGVFKRIKRDIYVANPEHLSIILEDKIINDYTRQLPNI